MAERVGFEPTVPVKVRRISSAVLSTTQPPLHLRGPSKGAETSGAAPLPQGPLRGANATRFLEEKNIAVQREPSPDTGIFGP